MEPLLHIEVAQPETERTMNIFYIIGVVVVVLTRCGILGSARLMATH